MSASNVQATQMRETRGFVTGPLLERERQLQELAEWLAAARSGGRIVLVGGEAGMGKTSLMQEFARQQRKTRVLWGACDSLFTPRPLAPLHDIARQARGALLTTVTAATNREVIFNAALDELEHTEALVVFEDVHWADEATLDLLKFLGRRIHRTKALLAITYRDDEVHARHPLCSVLGELPRASTRRMLLSPLSESAVADLARQAGRSTGDLHRITGGNPLFVTEVLAEPTASVSDLERSLRIALAGNLQEHVARAYTNLTSSSVASRNYELARRYVSEGIAYCEEHDLDSWALYMTAWRARLKFELCDWDGAGEDAQKVLQNCSTTDAAQASALIVLGQLRTRRGDPQAAAALNDARTLVQLTEELQRIVPLTVASAEAAWLAGDPAAAVAELLPVYERALTTEDHWIKSELAAWLQRLGTWVVAPEKTTGPYALELVGKWREAAHAWEKLGCRHDQAAVLARYGGEAEKRRALEMFEELGSTLFAQALRRQMRLDGVRCIPRGSRRSTRDHSMGLTQREAQIFDLMSQGLRNSEIATKLFVSTRTVDHHVSAILTKLGVPSRAAALAMAHKSR